MMRQQLLVVLIALCLIIQTQQAPSNSTNNSTKNGTSNGKKKGPKKGEKFNKDGKSYEYKEKKPKDSDVTTGSDNKEKPYFKDDTYEKNCY